MMEKYRDFCKETRCVAYNLQERLSSMQKTDTVKRDIEIAEVQCRQNCQRTAHNFYEWLKEKEPTNSP